MSDCICDCKTCCCESMCVGDPCTCAKDAEITRLRAEVAAAKAQGAVEFMEAEWLDGRGSPKGWKTCMEYLVKKARSALSPSSPEEKTLCENKYHFPPDSNCIDCGKTVPPAKEGA